MGELSSLTANPTELYVLLLQAQQREPKLTNETFSSAVLMTQKY